MTASSRVDQHRLFVHEVSARTAVENTVISIDANSIVCGQHETAQLGRARALSLVRLARATMPRKAFFFFVLATPFMRCFEDFSVSASTMSPLPLVLLVSSSNTNLALQSDTTCPALLQQKHVRVS